MMPTSARPVRRISEAGNPETTSFPRKPGFQNKDVTVAAGQTNGDLMEKLISEKYQQFNADDCVKSDADIRELRKAAADEDIGDGTVIRAVLKHVARTHNMKCTRPRHRAKSRPSLRFIVGRWQPHSGNPAENYPRPKFEAAT